MIYFCSHCKLDSKELGRHKLTCRFNQGETYSIHKFEHIYQFVDYYEKQIEKLEQEVAHHKSITSQIKGWYSENLSNLEDVIKTAKDEFEDWSN